MSISVSTAIGRRISRSSAPTGSGLHLLKVVGVWAAVLAAVPGSAAWGDLTAVWANDGGDKVARGELRASSGRDVTSGVWDGERIRIAGARNEVVAFVLVLESAVETTSAVSVDAETFIGPSGATIFSVDAAGNGVFDWTERPVEVFLVRYLQIRGLGSDLHYDSYDERHVPERFRRPWSGEGDALPGTGWYDRPDADAFYPEIAVPIELVGGGAGTFSVSAGHSQSVWVDVFVPRSSPSGLYRGTVTVRQSGVVTHRIPVELTVFDFELPDVPVAAPMLFLGQEDIGDRYAGDPYPPCGSAGAALVTKVRDRHFQIAHRHRISLVDTNDGSCDGPPDRPRPEWVPRLDGSLFTPASGYAGPGVGRGNGVFSIGTYGTWSWQGEGEAGMWAHTDAWESWFRSNAPSTERFLYLFDEPGPGEFPLIERWAGWMEDNPGPGGDLASFCTMPAIDALDSVPSLDIPATWFTVGRTAEWESAVSTLAADPSKWVVFYNGNRPAAGSFATEDDGVALRVLEWARYKKGIDRWFYWESTYYDNFQGNTGQTNVFRQAQTFGENDGFDPVLGEHGFNYGNGDGVLFYPGTDLRFPADSYGVDGPFASLRLKHWRRGIQDVEYLVLAARIDPLRVSEIVEEMTPEVLWELGVEDPSDPTWVLSDISWSTDPDDWEAARMELANLITGAGDDGGDDDGGDDGDEGDDDSPVPPPGPWLTSDALPGFRGKVLITTDETTTIGTAEGRCIPETLCVSGAVPGRSEVFVRVVGPKPNGYLWPTLVKFSTSTVEVWIEQVRTGVVRYYVLAGARPGFDELPGLFDRAGFLP